jgi:hypothetical protein
MAIDSGDADCTTGLSGAIYSAWIADPTNGFLDPLPAGAVALLKAQSYRWAVAIADAHNADAPLPGVQFTAPLANDFASTSSSWTDVTGMVLPVLADGLYEFEFVAPFYAAAAQTLEVRLTGPTAPTRLSAEVSLNGAVYGVPEAFASAVEVGGGNGLVRVRVFLKNGSSAGSVQLQAHIGTNGQAWGVRAGAFVRFAKVG